MASSVTSPIYSGYHVPVPTAPSLAFAGTGGSLGTGAYIYAVTFVTPNGETASGATVTATPTAGQVGGLTAIPTGSAFVTARKIYRTTSAGSQLKLLATINDNTTTTYSDSAADGTLGANIPVNSTADPITTINGTANLGTLIQQTAVTNSVAGVSAITANGGCGLLTFTGVTTAAVTSATATVTNSAATTSSLINVDVNGYSGTWVTNGIPIVSVDSSANGSFVLRVTNVHATNALNGTLKVYFSIVN